MDNNIFLHKHFIEEMEDCNPNLLIVSTEIKNFDKIISLINSKTILIAYLPDDFLETIIENIKAELDGRLAENIGIVSDNMCEACFDLSDLLFSPKFLITLSGFQTINGHTDIITLQSDGQKISQAAGIPLSQFFKKNYLSWFTTNI